MKALIKSFGYAFEGIFTALKNERNMRIHTVCMIYMYFFLFAFDFFEITRTELAIIFIANGLVMGAELINTSIESAVNLYGDKHTEYGKIAKDCAAGAVLVSIPIGLLFIIMQRYYVEGVTGGAVKE